MPEKDPIPSLPPEFNPMMPLREDSPQRDFPTKALPPILQEMVTGIAETTGTDTAMAATSMLSAVSYCFTGMYRMQGKTDHSEPPMIYSFIVAEPSERKSPVVKFIKKPFVDFEMQYNQAHAEEFHKAEAMKKKLLLEADKLEKEDSNEINQIAKLRTQAEQMIDVGRRRIVVDDITPESLIQLMGRNRSLLMISDEAGMLGNFAGRYSNNSMPNMDMILKAWSGESFFCDRATKDTIQIPNPCLSISLAGQPYLWDNMVSNPVFRNSGLLARFFYCFPKSKVGTRRYDSKAIAPAVVDSYNKLINILLTRKFNAGDAEEKFLKFDEIAQQNFIDYYNQYIEKIQLTEFANCKDWGGKYHGQILRLCCVIHCVKCVLKNENPENVLVSADTLCNAINIADYYKEEAIYAFSIGGVDQEILKAEKALEIIKAKQIKEGFQSALLKKCRNKIFAESDDFYKALKLLEEYGYVALDERETGNHKSAVYVYVNPKVFEKQSDDR
ncbi:MAG: YfjI family protein [Ruminococcus sp.]